MTRIAILLLFASLLAPPARAVIKAPTPPNSLYEFSQVVVSGTVTKFAADTGNLEATATTLKGTPVGEVVRFKLENLPAVAARIKPGDPLVLFVARAEKNAALHIADTWLLPQRKGPALFAVSTERDLRQSYPGTTAALARLVAAVKDGKYDMLNEVHPDNFKGGLKDLGKLDAPGATALRAVHLPDRSTVLVAISPTGVKAFTVARDGSISPADATKLDPAVLATDAPVVGAFADEGKPAAFAVRDGMLILEPQGGAPLDFTRLTGERLETYFKGDAAGGGKPLAGATCAALDANGDGRTDLLLHTPARTLLLINRGYGAFFINPDVGQLFVDAAGKPVLTGKTPWTCLDVDGDAHDDLVFLSADGTLRALLNPKPKEAAKP
ncbi:MAG: FG-GAP repeat domain-containing protein [Phycisphaerae bacterium]